MFGRGALNIWRPGGYLSRGTKPVGALEVFSPLMSRETFTAAVGKTPDQRQYLPGEVIVYGNGDMAVCIDGSRREIAIPLGLFSSADGGMADFPLWENWALLVSRERGYNVLTAVYTLVVALQQWVDIRAKGVSASNDPYCSQQERTMIEYREGELMEDIHDLRYLCYSDALHRGIKVSTNEPRLGIARQNVETYLRSLNEASTDFEYQTAADHFITIGLKLGAALGPQYGLPGQSGW